MNRARRLLYVSVGTLCLALGAIGIFLPLLPTTPFWLLACWCYVRGSRRLYMRLLRHPYAGVRLRRFLRERTMPRSAKIVSIGMMWLSLALSVWLWQGMAGVKLLHLGVCVAVTWLIARWGRKNVV